jgi:hypothetical protein
MDTVQSVPLVPSGILGAGRAACDTDQQGKVGMTSMARRVLRRIPRTRLAALAATSLVLVSVAPDPPRGPCDWDDSLMTEFDVADRSGIAERIPDFARAPEVTGEGEVLVNGQPAGLAVGPLHVRVIRCVRSDQLAVFGQLRPGSEQTVPRLIHGVVAITNASGELTLYADVSFGGLVAN